LPDYGKLEPVRSSDKVSETDWIFGNIRLNARMRCHPRGCVGIDYVGRPWPDSMGNPTDDALVFGAWSMGMFGPFAWPGGLERAVQQSHAWPEAHAVVPTHDGFIRLRVSYPGGQNDPVHPADYRPLPELDEVTGIASRLTQLPEALCYFNSSGEMLLSPNSLAEKLDWSAKQRLPSMDIWTNVRMYNLANQAPGWFLMDTVGMLQLDVDDHEAMFPIESYKPKEVAQFLRNISIYVLAKGDVVKHRDTTSGPGDRNWQAFKTIDGFYKPARQTIRWYPLDGSVAPAAICPPKENT
jgi:hypothetical protein